MKNGEKFCFNFPDVAARIFKDDVGSAYIEVEKDDEWIADFDVRWWNAEYKENPTGSTTKKTIADGKSLEQDIGKWIVKEESTYPCRGRMRCECDRCGYTKNAEYRDLAYGDAPKYIMPQFCEKCGNKKSNTVIYPTK